MIRESPTLRVLLSVSSLLLLLAGCEDGGPPQETEESVPIQELDDAVPVNTETESMPIQEIGDRVPVTAQSVSVQEIGDTVIVTTPRTVPLDTAHLTHVATFGRFDGPEEFVIAGVEAFTVGWYGEVYIVDDGIKVFSPDGSEVRSFSRTGEGPGEIESVVGLEVDEGGRLLVVDQGNLRVAVFDTSGVVLDHWRLPYGRRGFGRSAIIPTPENETLLASNPLLDPSGGPLGFPRPIFLRLDSFGEVIDTVFAPLRLAEKCPALDDPHFASGMWQDIREPVIPKVKWTASRSGEIVLGCPEEYEVDRVQPDGTVLRVFRQRDPFVDSEDARRDFVESWESMSRHREAGWRWKGPRPPEEKPYYHRMIMGRGGRLWVWPGYPQEPVHYRGPPARTVWRDPQAGAFDVFDAEGRFLGPVLLPDGVGFEVFTGRVEPFFAGDTVWLLRRDSLDVQYIDRMLISW